MEHFANSLAFSYNGMLLVPKWLLYVITGALGSMIISLLHRGETGQTPAAAKPASPKKMKAKVEEVKAEASSSSVGSNANGSPSPKKKGGAKKRNGNGKKQA